MYLRSKLIPHRFNVNNVIANLCRLIQWKFAVFFRLFSARFGNQIAENHQRILIRCPANSALIRTYRMKTIFALFQPAIEQPNKHLPFSMIIGVWFCFISALYSCMISGTVLKPCSSKIFILPVKKRSFSKRNPESLLIVVQMFMYRTQWTRLFVSTS